MFQPTSRYYNLETVTLVDPDGRMIAYKRRRFLPSGNDMPLLGEVTVTQDDRLDNITARTLGDPELFWLLCDANNAMNPDNLISRIGGKLRVPMPQAQVAV
jgi:hypothetical protein